ncbi:MULTISPECIES: hypothetical protein [unclassified Streptomyces]|uniref:hypothetical protein n=1 Tax=unclassified Streptomyces TaxID=2593676 RepID=UPI00081E4D43|nr:MULTISPECIES: hypothetical protein [unclassified Streptomyces]SCD46108.1 hypothetical protein GA0115243_102160 [Streptomyces sp. ScaeMP-e83]
MPDPTQLTQPDEALRQTLAIEEAGDIRQLLTRIADRLTGNLPSAAMREVNRLAYARQYAEAEHGYGTEMAGAVERALLRQMPRLDDRTITRGEYALLLRARAGRSTRAERVAELQREAAEAYTSAHPREGQARAALVYARIDGNASA